MLPIRTSSRGAEAPRGRPHNQKRPKEPPSRPSCPSMQAPTSRTSGPWPLQAGRTLPGGSTLCQEGLSTSFRDSAAGPSTSSTVYPQPTRSGPRARPPDRQPAFQMIRGQTKRPKKPLSAHSVRQCKHRRPKCSVHGPFGQDLPYGLAAATPRGLIHDFRSSKAVFESPVHDLSTTDGAAPRKHRNHSSRGHSPACPSKCGMPTSSSVISIW
jgi:hypothetical protein